MPEPRNDHGWKPAVGFTIPGASGVHLAPAIDERRRCGCLRAPLAPCQREATQEDLLCDDCRETCR